MNTIQRNHTRVLWGILLATIFGMAESSIKPVVAVHAESTATNVLSNGDFSDPSGSGWDLDSCPSAEIQDTVAMDGNALKLVGQSGQYIQHGSVPLTSNTVYGFTYYINVTEANNLTFSTYFTGGSLGWVDFSSTIVTSVTDGWQKISALLTVPVSESATQGIYIGFRFYNNTSDDSKGTGVVYLDNISLVKVMSAAGIGPNLSFESQYEGTPINWSFSGQGTFESQSDVLPEKHEGSYAAKIVNPDANASSYITSTAIPVNPDTTYEFSYDCRLEGDYLADSYSMFIQYQDEACSAVAYSPSFNASNAKNYYRSTGNGSDHGTEFINPTWNYHIYGDSAWRRVAWSFTTGKDTHYLKCRFIVASGECVAYFDEATLIEAKRKKDADSSLKAWAQVDPNSDFEYIDSYRKPINWTLSSSRSHDTILTSDDNYFHSGRRSLYLENDTMIEKSILDSSARIPVTPGDIYEFEGYFSSRNCDPTVKTRLCLTYYDEDGGNIYNEYGDKLYLQGETYVASCSSGVSSWTRMYTRSAIPSIARYVSYHIEVTSGHAEMWFDDLRLKKVEAAELEDAKIVFHSAFDHNDSDGVVDEWRLKDDRKAMWVAGQEGAELIAVACGENAVYRKLDCFISNYYYRLRFSYNASADGYLRIDFYDSAKKLRTGYSVEVPLSVDSNPVDTSFFAPSATYAIISLGLNGEGTLHANSVLIEQTKQPSSKGSWSGKWVWLNENPSKNPEQYRYFRYTFELEDVATYAPLQLSVDDKYAFYVNGIFIDYNWDAGSDSWANIMKYFLQDYLVKGKNVFAFKCYNLVSDAGLLFDGKFTLANGKEFSCVSSRDVKVSITGEGDFVEGSTEVPLWAKPDYDDSTWENCKEYGMPPVSPWGPVFYDASLYVDNKVEVVSVHAQKTVEAGTTIDFEVTFRIEEPLTNIFDFTVGLVKSATSASTKSVQKSNLKIISDNADETSWPVNEDIVVRFELPLSSLLDTGRYDLRLESSVVSFTNADLADNRFLSFKVLESTKENEDLTASVSNYNGAPTLMINGKPYSPVLYLRPDLNVYRQTDAEDRISNSTYELYVTYQGCLGKNGQDILYRQDGTLDYEAFDDAIISMVNASGNGYVMVNFGMFAPNWWKANHLDDLVYSYDTQGGVIPDPNKGSNYVANATDVSFSSLEWRQTSNELLGKLIDHMKGQKYYSRIFGLRLTAGQTYEFMNVGAGGDYLPDYSPVALARFKAWAKEKYQTVTALREAWKDETVTFESIQIPSMQERTYGGDFVTIYDIRSQAWKIDYNRFLSEESGNALLTWAKTCKEKTNRTRVVGAYYGYLWTFGSYDGTAKFHGNLEKVLSSPDIDFIASPINYNERILGMSSTFMSALETVQSYGKLYLLEQDNRTFNSDGYSGVNWDASWDDSVGEQHSINGTIYNFKRDFANNFVNGSGYWHYDMYGGWLDDDQIYQFMAAEKRIYDHSYSFESIDYTNDVAVFVGDSTYSYIAADTEYNSSYTLLNALFLEQREYLNRMGTGYDVYALSSLTNGFVKPHKVNIFLSPFEITAEDNHAIQSYLNQMDNAYAVWIYASGISDGTTNANPEGNLLAVTGFELGINNKRSSLEVQISNASSNPLVKGLANKRYGTHGGSGTISPQIYIKDSDSCEKLGRLNHGGEAGLGVKTIHRYTSIYSAAPALPVNLLRNILDASNTHQYSKNNNDVIYSNSQYIALHSAYEEDKTIYLKGHYAVYDEFAEEYISLDCDHFSYHHEAGDTKIFRLEPVGGVPHPNPPVDPNQNATDGVNMGQFIGITFAIFAGIGLLAFGKFSFTRLKKRYQEKRRIP